MSETEETPEVEEVKEEVDNTFGLELEVALKEGCDFSRLRSISNGRALPQNVRAQAWQVLLGVANKGDPFADWDCVYDMEEQNLIRQHCQDIVDKLGNPDADRVPLTSDLESLFTLYCKSREQRFVSSNGWTDIVQLLLAVKLPKAQLYHVFFAFTTKYIPQGCVPDGKPFDLFRLLLLYHDPELCSYLDTRKITPDLYAKHWFGSLFAATGDLAVVLIMWDVYLQQADPFLVFFMALVMLLNAKEQIMEMSSEPKEQIIETISGFPCQLGADDIEDFCQLAAFYSTRTPQSFRRDYHGPLFGSNLADEFESVTVHSLLCLPVSVQELLQSHKFIDSDDVRYFVVDGRPLDQYMTGHLPGAFNLDASLLVNSPEEFHLAAQSLCAFKAKTHPNDHLCFMGSGHEAEDQYLHMLISNFLQKGYNYISLARGGYRALHQLLRESLSTRLKAHNVKGCQECSRQSPSKSPKQQLESFFNGNVQGPSFTERIKDDWRIQKLAQVKDKVVDYIVNAPVPDEIDRHVEPGDRKGRPYRNTNNVFSIESDSDGDAEVSPDMAAAATHKREKVKISAYINRPEISAHFDAQQVEANKTHTIPCTLAMTTSHLLVLRPIAGEDGWCHIHSKRALANVQKITSKRRVPELLTIKYGYSLTEGHQKVTGVDKFFVPKAGDCAKALKTAIVALHEL